MNLKKHRTVKLPFIEMEEEYVNTRGGLGGKVENWIWSI